MIIRINTHSEDIAKYSIAHQNERRGGDERKKQFSFQQKEKEENRYTVKMVVLFMVVTT